MSLLTRHHHIHFNIYFPYLPGLAIFLQKTSKHLNLARSVLIFLSFRSILITSFHFFLGRSLRKLSIPLKVLHSLDEAFSYILFRWTNYSSLLSCQHFRMLLNFSLVSSSSVEILSPSWTLQIHLAIFISFFSSLITSSSLTDHVSFPCYITLHTHTEHNLLLASKCKFLLANKSTTFLKLLLPILLLLHPSSSHCATKIKELFQNFKCI